MDLEKLETEFKKRLEYPYVWGTRQNNYYNGLTNFIYQTKEFDTLLKEIDARFKGKLDYQAFFNYALNRWYNFWSAQAVEQIFCQCDGVVSALDSRDRLIDFSINGINFDHKTSVYPKGYGLPLKDALSNKGSLIDWLYENQSQQQRHHLKNRLFIVVYSNNGEHWKVKSEITLLSGIIKEYVKDFNEKKLLKFTLEDNLITLSDIIWVIK